VNDIKQNISTVSSCTGRIPELTGLIQKEIYPYNERTVTEQPVCEPGSLYLVAPTSGKWQSLRALFVAAEDSENKGTFRSGDKRSIAELSLSGCANMRVCIFVLVLNKEKLHTKLET
jgi:hypothetical protein